MRDDRPSLILQYLFAHGHSTVQDIADAVGASLVTVRRDLIEMEALGRIARTHGGARIAEGPVRELAFSLRESRQIEQKRAIAEAAYANLTPGASVFLDAGTTVLQLARRIRMAPLPLLVFTNCLPVAQLLIDLAPVKVTLLGGTLRPENASMVGPLAEAALERLWFSHLFLGAGAIGPEGMMSSADEAEARLNQAMLARAEAVTVLADVTKFGARLTYGVAPLAPPMALISDAGLGAEWDDRLQALGVRLIRAAGPGQGAP
jgi:DeoR/GlpR family transcriptional regulator of sugar metabolism